MLQLQNTHWATIVIFNTDTCDFFFKGGGLLPVFSAFQLPCSILETPMWE